VEPGRMVIVRQWHGKHLAVTMNTRVTVEELWAALSFALFVLSLYNE
jgi:hypothetical protein